LVGLNFPKQAPHKAYHTHTHTHTHTHKYIYIYIYIFEREKSRINRLERKDDMRVHESNSSNNPYFGPPYFAE
jgi:hypothetical protein